MTTSPRHRFILITIAGYTALALGWIFLSEQLLLAFSDVKSIVWLASARGVFLVIFTAAVFFFALRAVPANETDKPPRLLETLAESVEQGPWHRWLAYTFALASALAMTLVRDRLPVEFGNRPLLILFMFPIIISALLGGLGPGLVSTAVAALGVDYVAIAPERSFQIASGHDLMQWCFLIANGVVVSLFSEVLRRSRARAEINRRLLDSVISGTADAVFVKDLQGRYVLANTAAANFFGKTPDEIIGHDDSQLLPDASATKLMARDRTIMTSGRMQTHEEHLTMANGRTLVFLATRGPMFDAAGDIVGLFGISHDITERKRAENEIRKLNSELEQLVTERSAELRSANLELEDLAYSLTHNLRSPLRAIGSFSHELMGDHGEQFGPKASACIGQIVQANESMGRLLDGVLALLRCTRGELRREPVDISALASRYLDQLAGSDPQRQMNRQVEAGLSLIGDPGMLESILTHLLDNAWKFTRDQAHPVIRVVAGDVDGQSGICVADNGAGFDMAHAGRLFQPFQRLHRQDEFPGTGIGLATVQRIIHRHGGNLRVEAAPGQGAMFCFSLPKIAAVTEVPDE